VRTLAKFLDTAQSSYSVILHILKHDFHGEMVARVNDALRDVDATKEETRPDVFQIILTFPYEPEIHLWCAIHLSLNPEGLVICEFEEY
jgi:hypothetical protein